MTPRDTFNTYVRPALQDCEAEPGALHRAVSALCHIDVLAEEVWRATKANQPRGGKRKYRRSLAHQCIELGYAWDIHDFHKHGALTEDRAPILPNGRRPRVIIVRRRPPMQVIQPGAYIHVFQTGGTPTVMLELPDGKPLRALEVIKRCVEWWDAELGRLGWP
jgi:hypothetical protein